MNQILAVEMQKDKKKSNKKVGIKSVVLFFCILLIIFGISIISTGVFLQNQGERKTEEKVNVANGEKPKIEIIQDVSKLNISVTGKKVISKVVYQWNNEEATQVNGNNETTLTLDEIKIPMGTNILTVTATDEDGVEETFKQEYNGVKVYEPEVGLKQDGNKIKIICNSEVEIDYISYYFDNDQIKSEKINNVSAEIETDILQGEHELTILVVNKDGEKYEDTNKVYIPTVQVATDGENFIVTAEDERGITKVQINFNGNEEEIEVNDKKFTKEYKLANGENRIIVTVFNSDGLSITKRVKHDK